MPKTQKQLMILAPSKAGDWSHLRRRQGDWSHSRRRWRGD